MKPSFSVVGCGRVGTALAVFLTRAGYRAAGFSSKSLSSAKRVANRVHSDHFSRVPWEITVSADIVFITTPDSAIIETCDDISTNQGFTNKTVVFHCSGALASSVLSSAKRCGAHIGSMHPLQSFASTEYEINPFQGIIISIEGEDHAVKTARKIVADLDGMSVGILTEFKTFYHASAVVASNYLVTVLDLAIQLIGAAGIKERDAFSLLRPLIDGTLSNIEKVGTKDALTGPISRGDVKTVEKHIQEINDKRPDLVMLYKSLGAYTVKIAAARGTMLESTLQRLKSITRP